MPDPIILQELIEGNDDLKWLSENYEKLRSKYKNKFIALKGKEVVMEHRNMEELIKNLLDKYGDIEEFRIEFMPDDEFALVI